MALAYGSGFQIFGKAPRYLPGVAMRRNHPERYANLKSPLTTAFSRVHSLVGKNSSLVNLVYERFSTGPVLSRSMVMAMDNKNGSLAGGAQAVLAAVAEEPVATSGVESDASAPASSEGGVKGAVKALASAVSEMFTRSSFLPSRGATTGNGFKDEDALREAIAKLSSYDFD